jgi:pathogenesis-related protein 1
MNPSHRRIWILALALLVPAPPVAARGKPPVDRDALVAAHNRVRARHCAPPLRWSAKVAQSAQRWADSLRGGGCNLRHSGGQYGENLAAGTAGMLDPATVVGMWYDEVKRYSFRSAAFSMQTGHFTQVVWRATTEVGCGHVQCGGIELWVCQYDPPGNVQGQFRANVQPTSCR